MSDNFAVKNAAGQTISKASKEIATGVHADKQVLIKGSDNALVDPASEAKQDTANSALGAPVDAAWASGNGSIISLLKTIATGAANVVFGTPTDAAWASGPGSVISLLKAIATGANDTSASTVGGISVIKGGSFIRPADTTAYAVGDLVANNATAGSVAPIAIAGAARLNGGTGRITGARLSKSGATLTNASFRVHLFKGTASTPFVTAANGDNGVFAPNAIGAFHIGYLDVVMDVPGSDGAKGAGAPARNLLTFDATAGSTSLYALLEARAAYVPTSAETFTLALEIDQD